jgi:hypothetical protein
LWAHCAYEGLHGCSGKAGVMNTTFIANLLAAIESRLPRREGRETRFLCPVHEDHNPSARWNSEKHVWHCDACGAGGGAYDLAKRLGVPLPDDDNGLTVEALAEAKGIPADYLRSLGVTNGVAGMERQPCVDIPYSDAGGELKAVHKRIRLAGDRFRWRKGDTALPYGLTRVKDALITKRIFIFEGETDTWTFWLNGLAALGLPGADTWKEAFRRHLDGFDAVCVWREPGKGGDTFVSKIAADLPDILVIQPPPGIKDANELWLASGCDKDTFVARLKPLVAAARPASRLSAEALSEKARQAEEVAGHLLYDPNIFNHVREAIRLSGFAGNLTPPLLVYLGLTSRLLERPMNQGIIAPSAAGKNAAIDTVLPLFPPEAYFVVDAGSPRSLIYNNEDLRHRIIVFSEADSIPKDDSTAASALRTLATKQELQYDVVERDEETGHWTTRRIVREGPTGLITTSTRAFDDQWNTRMIQFGVDDTEGQTRKVLDAHAASVNGSQPRHEADALVALQVWLACAGDHEVTVPFAYALAALVPATFVRMRRDFRQLLTAIQAVTLLYQRQRGRDERGRVIATLEDYRQARDLLLDAFTQAASGGVSKEVREVVVAVADLHAETKAPVTRRAVAQSIGMSARGTDYRLTKAIDLGLVVNLETKPRQPAKLVPGEPLPEERPALPTVEEVAAWGGGGVNPPDNVRDFATDADEQVQDEPDDSVAKSSANTFADGFATAAEDATGSGSAAAEEAWRSGERNAGGMHPSPPSMAEEADLRGEVLSLATERGYPRMLLRQGESVGEGDREWGLFIKRAPPDRLEWARQALVAIKEEEHAGD